MTLAPEVLLVGAVVGVGVLHTLVPDHWVPIALIARQPGWSLAETARVALRAGTGHVISTLLIGIAVWIVGVTFAARLGSLIGTVSSIALIAFGSWIALSSLRDMRRHGGHGHTHGHESHATHSAEIRRLEDDRPLELSIFETGVPPVFRLSGDRVTGASICTTRPDGRSQTFFLIDRGAHWESIESIPQAHAFSASVTVAYAAEVRTYAVEFSEDDHRHPVGGALAKHAHAHRHGNAAVHVHEHEHEHDEATSHARGRQLAIDPPLHEHSHARSMQTALLLIIGSSPMIEGIPAFFAAARFGLGFMCLLSGAFAVSTIATYVALCVVSADRLQRVGFGKLEVYGETLSGAFIALVGLVFLFFPML